MSPPLLELFRQGCGATGPLRLEILFSGREVPEVRTFELPFLRLGRDRRNDLCLAGNGISMRHAYLQVLGGSLFFTDLGSRTGVYREGRLRPFGWLAPGQALRIQAFTLRQPSPADGPPASGSLLPYRNPFDSRSPDAPLSPGVTLEIAGGPPPPIHWRVNRLLTLMGTASGCKLRLRDPAVSRFHCALLHTPLGVWVIDLISSRGTLLNGQPIDWARLADGDELQIGPFRIRASYDSPEACAAAGTAAAPTIAVMPWTGGAGEPAAEALVPAALAELAPRDHPSLQPMLDQFQVMQQQMLDQFQQTMLMMAQMFTTLHREQIDLVREELERMHRLTAELQDLRARLAGPAPGQPARAAGPALEAPRAEQGRTFPAQTPPPPTGLPEAGAAPETTADPGIHAWLSRRIAELNAEREGSWQKIRNFLMGK